MAHSAAKNLLVACLGLTLGVLSLSPVAWAQSADLALCDRIAADPSDPDKPANIKGVAVIAESDIETAIKFCKTASGSSRRALYQLGRAYAANRQVAEAVAIYKKAVDKGSSSAMVDLGVMYGTGTGVARDPDAARQLFERAAAANNPRGVANLASLSGGTPADPAQARSQLMRAAESNSPEAQFQLGVMAAEGTGGPKDDVLARSLFEKAAAQGHENAMVWYAAFVQLGRGGPQNDAVAKTYYEKAAALGNEEAKAALRRMQCPYVLKDKRGNVISDLCF